SDMNGTDKDGPQPPLETRLFKVLLATRAIGSPLRSRGFPFALALLPHGVDATALGAAGQVFVMWTIDDDCAPLMLNDRKLQQYIQLGFPVVVHARRACDLRPILQRREFFHRSGYRLEVLSDLPTEQPQSTSADVSLAGASQAKPDAGAPGKISA